MLRNITKLTLKNLSYYKLSQKGERREQLYMRLARVTNSLGSSTQKETISTRLPEVAADE